MICVALHVWLYGSRGNAPLSSQDITSFPRVSVAHTLTALQLTLFVCGVGGLQVASFLKSHPFLCLWRLFITSFCSLAFTMNKLYGSLVHVTVFLSYGNRFCEAGLRFVHGCRKMPGTIHLEHGLEQSKCPINTCWVNASVPSGVKGLTGGDLIREIDFGLSGMGAQK